MPGRALEGLLVGRIPDRCLPQRTSPPAPTDHSDGRSASRCIMGLTGRRGLPEEPGKDIQFVQSIRSRIFFTVGRSGGPSMIPCERPRAAQTVQQVPSSRETGSAFHGCPRSGYSIAECLFIHRFIAAIDGFRCIDRPVAIGTSGCSTHLTPLRPHLLEQIPSHWPSHSGKRRVSWPPCDRS